MLHSVLSSTMPLISVQKDIIAQMEPVLMMNILVLRELLTTERVMFTLNFLPLMCIWKFVLAFYIFCGEVFAETHKKTFYFYFHEIWPKIDIPVNPPIFQWRFPQNQ